jgi:hypothetical protein
MAIIKPPPLTNVPDFPGLSDRAAGTYNGKAFAFGTHMADVFNDELGAIAANVFLNAVEAEGRAAASSTAAEAAIAAMQVALSAGNAEPWLSGTAYAKNALVISQVNFQPYRRAVAGSGTVDPANDTGTAWIAMFGNGTLTPVTASSSTLDLSTGNYFTRTMTASETLSFANCPSDGFSFCIELTLTSGTLALPSSVRTPNNLPYSMSAARRHLLFFVTSNRGARWHMSAAINYGI